MKALELQHDDPLAAWPSLPAYIALSEQLVLNDLRQHEMERLAKRNEELERTLAAARREISALKGELALARLQRPILNPAPVHAPNWGLPVTFGQPVWIKREASDQWKLSTREVLTNTANTQLVDPDFHPV